MSWQLLSFALVLLALAACFWWYERSRPPSKVVAVVATLAALAALGRDAFAALPDVKPITAMVLIAGYAFGAGPGFAVGAIGALASNILLGQGPWTPWQMLGWGLVGMAGAVLGHLTGRRLGRVALALACAAAAELFNLILNLYTWTVVGSHTLAAYGAVLGTASVFDVTHVLATFSFALAFGPALLRMLLRVRARLEVTWHPAGAVPLALAAGILVAGAAALGADGGRASAAPAPRSAARAISYLTAAQNADGGFGAAPGQASSELYSAWTAIGLAAAGIDPLGLRRQGHTVLDALRSGVGQLSGPGDLERTILALHAARAPDRTLAGRDLLGDLLRARQRDGSFSGQANTTAFAIFALRAAGMTSGSAIVRAAGRWLAAQQNGDGGFAFSARGGASDIDDTAAALQGVVVALGRADGSVSRAVAYLAGEQNSDGGFPLAPGGNSDAQSTAWVVQALAAAGRSTAPHRRGAPAPLQYLQRLFAADGSVRYSSDSGQTPVWVTAQVLTAFARRPFPVGPAPPAVLAASVAPGAAAAPRRRSGLAAAAPGPGAHHRAGVSPRRRTLAQTGGRRSGARRRSPVRSAQAAARDRLAAEARAGATLAGLLLGPIVG